MKLPSINVLLHNARETLSRFPFAILSSVLAALTMIRIVDYIPKKYEGQFLWNLVMTFTLGLPLFLSFSLFAESRGFSRIKNYALQIIPAVFLVLYFFTLSDTADFYDVGRYILFIIAFHLLVAFSPFIFSKEYSFLEFWNFNQTVFLRFILSGLYSAVLYGGLAIAVLSFDKLFNMDIDEKRYLQLFLFIAGIFNTWFFCAGVPEKLKLTDFVFPKGLKIFTQYVLLPIIVIYVLILYLYLFKILFSWNLPVGWVSNLVIGFSTAGIFSLLLIYPLMESSEIKWVKLFSRVFFISLIPQIVLLFLAISTRTSEYGITERRYFVFVIAFWLSITTLFFIIRHFRNIKYIPVSLFLIAVLTSVGPWSAFRVSMNSQVGRIEETLSRNSVLAEGRITAGEKNISSEDVQEIRSILNFLKDRNRLALIQPWFSVSLDSLQTMEENNGKQINISKEESIMKQMGIKDFKTDYIGKREFVSVSTEGVKELDITGFEKFRVFESVKDSLSDIKSEFNNEKDEILIYRGNDSLRISAKTIADTLTVMHPYLSSMTFEKNLDSLKVKFIISRMEFQRVENKPEVNYVKGFILWKNLK